MAPDYPGLPFLLILQVTWALLSGKRRNFAQDSRRCVQGLMINIIGKENIPLSAPGVIVFNHYSRPGFAAWWIALALSSVISLDIHWTMTAAWTENGNYPSKVKAKLSEILFPRIAGVYGFTTMPPMPPRSFEVLNRARAVRQVLELSRRSPPVLLALAPEGQDSVDGKLMELPPGAGRFLALLNGTSRIFYPLGVYEEPDALCLNFGLPFQIQIPSECGPKQLDTYVSSYVMNHIAQLIPESLRGIYSFPSAQFASH